MAAAIFYGINAFVLFAVLGSLVFWTRRLIHRLKSGASLPPLVAMKPRESPRWSVGEFILMFGLMILSFAGLSYAANKVGWVKPPVAVEVDSVAEPLTAAPGDQATAEDAPDLLPLLAINTFAGAIAMGITLIWLITISGCTLSHVGLKMHSADVQLGLKGAFWFIPPVLLISMFASMMIPYEHPVLDTLAANKVFGTWLMLFVSTAMIVPAVEEFMFRVLLQGGLQRIADNQHAGSKIADSQAVGAPGDELDRQAVLQLSPEDRPDSWVADAYQPPTATSDATATPYETDSLWRPQSYWPIVVTSVFFALMHLGQGAAPIPLFFLSLGLGYLYRQSGSMIPPLIVHMILNGTTLAVEFSRMAAGIEPTGL
ncbi:CPBP family intramembrane glutamic endopeptidase [Stieleria marina]|uniref:CAAX amino terminal protease self-immunity n=1 Tax=Stieleria marina TaxID=1930275 RepID=A0A517NYB6_9BACT|nr:CAAX amino terminal protease self- immunity [Planctomycetes bacterium K23_9]